MDIMKQEVLVNLVNTLVVIVLAQLIVWLVKLQQIEFLYLIVLVEMDFGKLDQNVEFVKIDVLLVVSQQVYATVVKVQLCFPIIVFAWMVNMMMETMDVANVYSHV